MAAKSPATEKAEKSAQLHGTRWRKARTPEARLLVAIARLRAMAKRDNIDTDALAEWLWRSLNDLDRQCLKS